MMAVSNQAKIFFLFIQDASSCWQVLPPVRRYSKQLPLPTGERIEVRGDFPSLLYPLTMALSPKGEGIYNGNVCPVGFGVTHAETSKRLMSIMSNLLLPPILPNVLSSLFSQTNHAVQAAVHGIKLAGVGQI